MRKPGEMLEPLRALDTTTWLETAGVMVMKRSSGLAESAAKPRSDAGKVQRLGTVD
jgi:hypothetical protein